jgi:hypothetical protein
MLIKFIWENISSRLFKGLIVISMIHWNFAGNTHTFTTKFKFPAEPGNFSRSAKRTSDVALASQTTRNFWLNILKGF